MSHTTTKITIATTITAFFGISVIVAPMTQASGQFAPTTTDAVTYSNEDLAAGKADHLSDIQPFAITSESMYPLFKVGEMATMNYSVPFESIEEGDIIVFDSPVGHVSHRVIDIDIEEGDRIITTKGDANDSVIEGVDTDIDEDRFVGKVISH